MVARPVASVAFIVVPYTLMLVPEEAPAFRSRIEQPGGYTVLEYCGGYPSPASADNGTALHRSAVAGSPISVDTCCRAYFPIGVAVLAVGAEDPVTVAAGEGLGELDPTSPLPCTTDEQPVTSTAALSSASVRGLPTVVPITRRRPRPRRTTPAGRS